MPMNLHICMLLLFSSELYWKKCNSMLQESWRNDIRIRRWTKVIRSYGVVFITPYIPRLYTRWITNSRVAQKQIQQVMGKPMTVQSSPRGQSTWSGFFLLSICNSRWDCRRERWLPHHVRDQSLRSGQDEKKKKKKKKKMSKMSNGVKSFTGNSILCGV